MKPAIVAAAVLSITTLAAAASAEVKKPDAAPAAAEKPAAAAEAPSPTGVVVEWAFAAKFLGGKIAQGVDAGAMELGASLRLGAFVTRHVGLFAGVEGAYGYWVADCKDSDGHDSTACSSFSLELPVVAEYAFEGRRRGGYVEGGAALFHYRGAVAHPDAQTTQSITMMSPVDLRLAAGWRIPVGVDAKNPESFRPFDLKLTFDVGEFKSLSVNGQDVDIPSELQAVHYVVALAVGGQF